MSSPSAFGDCVAYKGDGMDFFTMEWLLEILVYSFAFILGRALFSRDSFLMRLIIPTVTRQPSDGGNPEKPRSSPQGLSPRQPSLAVAAYAAS